MEAKLKDAGLYGQYENRMLHGHMTVFLQDVEEWAVNLVINKGESFVTEQGDVEKWKASNKKEKEILSNIKEYIKHLQEHIK